jgi:biotin transport system substrate-specific component
MAAVTGLLAQLRVNLWFTPIPLTGQVLGVLLSGVFLGGYYAGIAQIMYCALGLLGIPWFTNLKPEVALLLQPSLGYIIGFIPAAAIVGFWSDRWIRMRTLGAQCVVMTLAVITIYACGAVYLTWSLRLTLLQGLTLGVLPFIPGDVIKIAIAANIAALALPKDTDEKH